MSQTPSDPPNGRRQSLANELDEALPDLDASEVAIVFLVGLSGRMAGKLFRIRPGESLIGRSSRSFVLLDEKAVSHKHARLKLDESGCSIEDMGSTNGTFLNDTRLTDSQLLNAGDVIRIGNNALGFLTDSEDEQQHTRAMARLTAPRLTTPLSGFPPPPGPGEDRSAHIVPASMPTSGAAGSPMVVAPTVSPTAAEPEASALDSALDKLDLILSFAKSYRILLLSGAIFGVVSGAAFVWIRPPPATAEFQIYLRQDATPDPNRNQYQAEFSLQGREFFAFAERKFTEIDLVLDTLNDVGVKADKRMAAATAAQMGFSAVDRQGTFQGSFTDDDPEFAEVFLAAHLQNFLEEEINKALAVHASEVQLMREELERNDAELLEVEQKLQKFKEEHLHALPENAMSQIQAKGTLLAQRDRLMADVTRYSGELGLAKKRASSGDVLLSSKVVRSQPYTVALTEVKKKIAAAQSQGLAEGHPELQRLREEERRYQNLEQEALSAKTTDIDIKSNAEQRALHDRVGELTVALNASQTELSQVQGRLGEIDKISGKMPEVEADITKLTRQATSAKEIHDRLHLELKGKELELQFERSSVAARYEIVEPPKASQPTLGHALIKWGGAGTVGGFMLAVVAALAHWLFSYARQRKTKVGVVAKTSALARVED